MSDFERLNHAKRRSRSRRRHGVSKRHRHSSSNVAKSTEQRLKLLERLMENVMSSNESHAEASTSAASALVPSAEDTEQPSMTPSPSVYSKSRFIGRLELVPEFDGSVGGLTIDKWLEKINSISALYHWDDQSKIFCTIARLTGNAKSWYDCQVTTPETWVEWEQKLKLAFPPNRGIASKLKDFVTIERKSDQDVIAFYYEKLRVGRHCNLPDEVIADVIISTMNNNLMKASAHAANCKTTEKLLQFLIDSDYVNTRREFLKHKQSSDKPHYNKYRKPIHNPNANLEPTSNASNSINNNRPMCTYCKKLGHTRESCFKLKTKGARPAPSEQINLIAVDDAKYHIKAKLNGLEVSAYVDFGSACNILKITKAHQLNIPFDKDRNIIIQGYGGATVKTVGYLEAEITVATVKRFVPLYVVADHLQNYDLLIGRPFTESPNTYVVKTSEKLEFYEENEFLLSYNLDNPVTKVDIYSDQTTTIVPGVNKIVVRSEIFHGLVLPNFSEQNYNGVFLTVPQSS